MIWTLWKKEVDSYFIPLGSVLIGLFSLISGTIFFNLLVTYTDGIQSIPPNCASRFLLLMKWSLDSLANLNFLFLFFIPLITMRLFSEERKSETLELYWLAPVEIGNSSRPRDLRP